MHFIFYFFDAPRASNLAATTGRPWVMAIWSTVMLLLALRALMSAPAATAAASVPPLPEAVLWGVSGLGFRV
jgi:hypothetical protein